MQEVVGNLPTVSVQNKTDRFFNNYFTSGVNISPEVNDAVIGFFQDFTGDATAGKLLASSIIYTATTKGLNPMEFIDELRKLKTGKKTEIKSAVDSQLFITEFASFQEIEAVKDSYSPGQFFYVPNTNVFYRLSENYRLLATTEFKAEIVVSPQLENNVYNFYKVEFKFEENELNAYLTFFLNYNRVNTSLLGINNSPRTGKYIERAILP